MDYTAGLAKFCGSHDKVMIQLWHSPELSMSALDIYTCSHGNPSLNEEKGEEVLFSLKSTYISLNSHLQTDLKKTL